MIEMIARMFGFRPQGPDPEPDDWEVMHGDWVKVALCHCGHRVCPASQDIVGGLCPECGHEDKWSHVVMRLEWEWSKQAYLRYINTTRLFDLPDVRLARRISTRNERWVKWTPEHCEVKDEAV